MLNTNDDEDLWDCSITDLHHTAVTRYIEADGTMYAYRAFGKKSGIPLFFLQHFTGTMDDWDPAITNGFAHYFYVVLFDNKGVGASGGKTPVTIEAMARDAIFFIKALGFKKVNILGFSMGGFIAQQIALDEPTLVCKLILAGTGPKAAEGLTGIAETINGSAYMAPAERKLYLFYSSTAASIRLGKESLERIDKRIADREPAVTVVSIQAQLMAMLDWAEHDIEALNQLKQTLQPVLIVNGNNDIMVHTINSYILYQNLPNARLSLYPNSGHGAIFQYYNLFLSEAIAFLYPC